MQQTQADTNDLLFTVMGSNATGMRAGNQAENNMSEGNLGLYCLAAQDVFRLAEDPA